MNYGWNQVEGDICGPNAPNCDLTAFTPPLITHTHAEMTAIMGGGGVVYRGLNIPGLCGVYLYGDFGSGNVKGLRTDGVQVLAQQDLSNVPFLSSLGYDENHEVYAVGYSSGALFKVSP